MRLKGKTLIVYVGTYFLAIMLALAISQTIVRDISTTIDRANAEFVNRTALNTLDILFQSIQSVSKDWAYWDEPYAYLEGVNPGFIEENISQDSTEAIHIDLMAFYDTDQQLVRYLAYNHGNHAEIELDESPAAWVEQYPTLFSNSNIAIQSMGVLPLAEGPLYVVSAPVLHNDRSGPSQGTLIVGSFLTDSLTDRYFKSAGYQVKILPIAAVIPDISEELHQNYYEAETTGIVEMLDQQYLNVINLLSDPENQVRHVFQVTFPRLFTQYGNRLTIMIIGGLSILGIACILIVYRVFDRLYIYRIEQLSHNLANISLKREPNSRLELDHQKDEITEIGSLINENLDMMQSLQDEYKLLINNQGEGVLLVGLDNVIQFANPAAEKICEVPIGELAGKDIRTFLSNKEQAVYLEGKAKHGTEETTSMEIEITTGRGHQKAILATTTVKNNLQGEMTGIYAIFRDISEIKKNRQILLENEVKFRSFIEQSSIGIFMADSDGRILDWNHRLEEITGITRDDVLKQTVEELLADIRSTKDVPGMTTNRIIRTIHSILAGNLDTGSSGPIQYEVDIAGERQKSLEISLFPICVDKTIRLGGIVEDVTEQRQIEKKEDAQRIYIEALLDVSEALNSVLDFDDLLERILINADKVISSDTGVILLLEDGILKVAKSRGYFERGLPEIANKREFPLTSMDNMKIMADTGQPLAIPNVSEYKGWNPIPENSWVGSYIGIPLCIRKKTIGFLSLFHETPGFYTQDDAVRLRAFANQTATAIENSRLYAELQVRADTDELTGLRNRRSFFELGAREVERSIRFNHPLSLLMIDLDYFKQVNDTFGHPVGDRLLEQIAENLKKNMRNIDLLARYGGDEMVAMLPENDQSHAVDVAKRIQKIIESSAIETAQGKASVGASIGVACINKENHSLVGLIESADRALYHAKKFGRGRVVQAIDGKAHIAETAKKK